MSSLLPRETGEEEPEIMRLRHEELRDGEDRGGNYQQQNEEQFEFVHAPSMHFAAWKFRPAVAASTEVAAKLPGRLKGRFFLSDPPPRITNRAFKVAALGAPAF